MKTGDKVRFVKHQGLNKSNNEHLGLYVGGVYEVQGFDDRDGSPFLKTEKYDYVPTYLEEVELIKNTEE